MTKQFFKCPPQGGIRTTLRTCETVFRVRTIFWGNSTSLWTTTYRGNPWILELILHSSRYTRLVEIHIMCNQPIIQPLTPLKQNSKKSDKQQCHFDPRPPRILCLFSLGVMRGHPKRLNIMPLTSSLKQNSVKSDKHRSDIGFGDPFERGCFSCSWNAPAFREVLMPSVRTAYS